MNLKAPSLHAWRFSYPKRKGIQRLLLSLLRLLSVASKKPLPNNPTCASFRDCPQCFAAPAPPKKISKKKWMTGYQHWRFPSFDNSQTTHVLQVIQYPKQPTRLPTSWMYCIQRMVVRCYHTRYNDHILYTLLTPAAFSISLYSYVYVIGLTGKSSWSF